MRRVEDITEALWGSKVSPATISELNKKAYVHIEDWRNRPLQGGRYPYVYVDGIYLRRNWGGEYENVAILVAIAVNEDGFREVLGAAEGMKEDKASWVSFFQWLRGRGLDGVKLIVGDKCMGMLEAVGEVFPDGNSALMLACARLRHVAGTQWGSKKYMNMKHLEAALDDAFIAGCPWPGTTDTSQKESQKPPEVSQSGDLRGFVLYLHGEQDVCIGGVGV